MTISKAAPIIQNAKVLSPSPANKPNLSTTTVRSRTFRSSDKTSGDSALLDVNNRVTTPIPINYHLHLGESHLVGSNEHWETVEDYVAFGDKVHMALIPTQPDYWDDVARHTVRESIKQGSPIFICGRGWQLCKEFHLPSYCCIPVMRGHKLKEPDNYLREVTSKSRTGIFLHSLYRSDPLLLKKCAKFLNQFGGPLYVHVSESPETRDRELSMWGIDPIHVLKQFSLLCNRTFVIHGGYLTDSELEVLSSYNCKLVICPINCRTFKLRQAEVERLQFYDVDWRVGTDGMATGVTLNLAAQFKELITTQNLQLPGSTIYSKLFQSPPQLPSSTRLNICDKDVQGDCVVWDLKTDAETLDDWASEFIKACPKAFRVSTVGRIYEPDSLDSHINCLWSEFYSKKVQHSSVDTKHTHQS